MLKMGILDPTKVTRTALQNAASIAGLMITTEAMVTELEKDDDAAAPAMLIWAAWAAWVAWVVWAEWECNSVLHHYIKNYKASSTEALFFPISVILKCYN